MKLLNYYKKINVIKLLNIIEAPKIVLVGLVVLGIVSGLFNLGIISLINEMVQEVLNNSQDGYNTDLIFRYLLFVAVWFISRKILLNYMIKLTQKTIWNFRVNIIKSIIQTDYRHVRKNKSKIEAALTEDVIDISAATFSMVDLLISLVTIIAVFIYLAYLSLFFFLCTLLIVGFGALVYALREKQNTERNKRSKLLLDKFHTQVESVLDGFKEVKLDDKRSQELTRHIRKTGDETVETNTQLYRSYLDNSMIGQISFYLLIASLGMFLGVYFGMSSAEIVTFLFTLLFIQGPLEMVMSLIPSLSLGAVAVDRVRSIQFPENPEDALKEEEEVIVIESFEKLEVEKLGFEYKLANHEGFKIENIDFSIRAGEVVFVTGGNGSGKTTFIHLLLALMNPTEGQVLVNGVPGVYSDRKKAYRRLFAPVFSDFFLFDQLYGISEVDLIEVNEYLVLFELTEKVTFENNHFSTRDLSTGQRKRLALICSLIEHKPILVLDEWAADQDPYFRKKFYLEIIPLLKSKGITLIAITHDDAYFNVADKVYNMVEGECSLVSEKALIID
jgi:putative ATP-binding cassette transporter